MKSLIYSILFLFLSGTINYLPGCKSESNTGKAPLTQRKTAMARSAMKTALREPADKSRFVRGEQITFTIEELSDTIVVDSVSFLAGGEIFHVSRKVPWQGILPTENLPVGEVSIRCITHFEAGGEEYNNLSFTLLSDSKPAPLKYRVANTYPHDIQAYTQGLVWQDGYLYEGTGNYNQSSLRKVEIKSGEPLRVMNLPGEIFGEGITIFQDKIFQLTYKSQVGFVYEKESFKRIQKIYYQNKEGWGLTDDGSNLIMSDGSHKIYFMDPEYFTETRSIEVYDDNGPVTRLNELEYINGEIYANIYGSEEIVVINPESGCVTGVLDMKDILPKEDRHSKIDVFNGIAWNPGSGHLYVTGKYWPKLFEIELLP